MLAKYYTKNSKIKFENTNTEIELSTLYNKDITIMPLTAKKCSPNINSLISAIRSMHISPFPATIGTNVLV